MKRSIVDANQAWGVGRQGTHVEREMLLDGLADGLSGEGVVNADGSIDGIGGE